jgi:hypothetical protein
MDKITLHLKDMVNLELSRLTEDDDYDYRFIIS